VTTYQTPNYGIHYCDDLTPVKQLADVITALATDVDSALGRGGVAPYDATSLAAEVAARQSADTALDTRVTTVEGKLTKSYVTPTFANSYAQFSTAPYGEKVRASLDAQGLVSVRGMVLVPAVASTGAVTMMTLPAGYRPAVQLVRYLDYGSGTTGVAGARWRCNIATDGTVQVLPATTVGAGGFAQIDWTFRTVEPS
jgi:hypothetical protein